MQELPLVLAGPVLRHCTTKEIFAWIALSKRVDVDADHYLEVEVYDAEKLPDSDEMLAGQRCSKSIAASYSFIDMAIFGPSNIVENNSDELPSTSRFEACKNLHIYLLRARAFESDLPVDRVLAYEVYLVEVLQPPKVAKPTVVRHGFCEHLDSNRSDNSRGVPVYQRGYSDDPSAGTSSQSDINGEKLLLQFSEEWRPNPLIRKYFGKTSQKIYFYTLPTFILQGKADLTVWAGSCMKLHGLGKSASTLMYESAAGTQESAGLLRKLIDKPMERAHALFLLGDQIYADDVSFILFQGVCALRMLLTGGEEEFFQDEGKKSIWGLSVQERRSYVRTDNDKPPKTPFGAERDVQNQLMSPGEFYAYYLMHLNPALWPDLKVAEQKSYSEISQLAEWSKFYAEDRVHRLDTEFERLKSAQCAILDYATVQANVPVYSICDDHEITDDWFFDKDWIDSIVAKSVPSTAVSKTEISQVGQYIVASGLHAFVLFQAIGNDPQSIVPFLITNAAAPNEDTYKQVLSQLLSRDYSFLSPTTPRALFLDTRTQRSGVGSTTMGLASTIRDFRPPPWYNDKYGMPPAPLNLPQMRMTTDDAIQNFLVKMRGSPIFLVTPSPILSSDGVERYKPGHDNRTDWLKNDAELWRSNYSNYFWLVELFQKNEISLCFNLAGDVHYGYRRVAELREDSQLEKSSFLKIEQLTCSPFLNEFESEYGNGSLNILKHFQIKAFNKDYDFAIRYTCVESKWVVERHDQVHECLARPAYVETLFERTCPTQSGKDVDTIVINNHFVVLRIDRRNNVTPIFYIVND